MNLTHKNEAPGLLAGAAGASEHKEGCDEHAPHTLSVSQIALDRNLQRYDLIVEAIRVLARRGREIRASLACGPAGHAAAPDMPTVVEAESAVVVRRYTSGSSEHGGQDGQTTSHQTAVAIPRGSER